MNKIVEHLKTYSETHGYTLKNKNRDVKSVITTPFADDFNIVSHNKIMHQALVTDVETKIKLMGLVIKPRKFRSLSIESCKTVNKKFKLNDQNGRDVNIDEPMKFLGSEGSGTNTPLAMFALIYAKLERKLENISKSTLRGEYKLNI